MSNTVRAQKTYVAIAFFTRKPDRPGFGGICLAELTYVM